MTIACCYVSLEGVILAADSTASYNGVGGMRHYNHNQKIFEVGNDATLGIVTWGLGNLGELSYRTLFARLADSVEAAKPASVDEVMDRWIDIYWAAYGATLSAPPNKASVDLCRVLEAKAPFDPNAAANPNVRTQGEESTYQQIKNGLTAGFCIGGHMGPDRIPTGLHVHFDPTQTAKPAPVRMLTREYQFWGAPNIFQRLIFGADEATKAAIVQSDKWTGDSNDLNIILAQHSLGHPMVPLRDAIDFVYMCIYSTIKAIKFSGFPRLCGGPIELAVISADRRFRWVRHKPWDAAVAEGATS